MRRRGAPTVRNTAGEASDFSLDRFARDLVVRGESLEAARSAGRQLLADLRRARVDVVTTDALRHWIAERDPLVFVSRRVREARAGGWHYRAPALGRIARLAEHLAPRGGHLLTELYLAWFRPEGLALETVVEEGPAPPLEDLEAQLGELADGLEWPAPPDYGREGQVGEFRPTLDATGRRIGFYVLTGADGHLLRSGLAWAPRCDQPFLVEALYLQPAPGCVGMDYRALVRASLLHAIAEAFRRCVPSRCEQAVSKIVYASWACGSNTASGYVQLEVRCTAL